MKKGKLKILVVAAHPDDEVLGCGATIARHVKSGHAVYVLILGEGISARYKDRKDAKKKDISGLKAQAREASRILGVKKIFFSDFPDNSFDSVPILKIIKEIEKIKKAIRPHVIYTHHYGDLNVDHRIAYNAVLTACRPLKNETVREIYSFEVPSSTEWSGPNKKEYFTPDRFVDASDGIDRKLKAMKCYRGEMRAYPHPRSLKAVRFHAAKRGSEAGLRFAESFETIRMVIQ
ncbi:PIG-L deacetylase family protein [Candidatus Omnitrophota bacterium]